MTTCSGCEAAGSLWKMPNGAHNGEIVDVATGPHGITFGSGVAEVAIACSLIDGRCKEVGENCESDKECFVASLLSFPTLDEENGWYWKNVEAYVYQGGQWQDDSLYHDIIVEDDFIGRSDVLDCYTQRLWEWKLYNSDDVAVETFRFNIVCSDCLEGSEI